MVTIASKHLTTIAEPGIQVYQARLTLLLYRIICPQGYIILQVSKQQTRTIMLMLIRLQQKYFGLNNI